MTPTGREAGQKIACAYPGRVTQCYLPYDTASLMGKFFDETRPVMGVVMETEVWPNMVAEANARGIPLVLANARESEKSAKQASRFAGVMGSAFGGLCRGACAKPRGCRKAHGTWRQDGSRLRVGEV